jgi:hypothetical protein
MCVPLSQNSMQAAKLSRPPPGVSGKATPELPPVGRAVGTAVEFEEIESGAIGKASTPPNPARVHLHDLLADGEAEACAALGLALVRKLSTW